MRLEDHSAKVTSDIATFMTFFVWGLLVPFDLEWRNLEEIGKNLPKNWQKIRKCAEKRAKSQNSAGKFSKTGPFQTAVAAQPIELSKKRRHF